MHLPIVITLAAATSTTAATINVPPRPGPVLGGFNLATSSSCPLEFSQVAQHVNINYGEACGACIPVSPADSDNATRASATTYVAIQDVYLNPWCRMTVHATGDCSDAGTVSGPECWAPEGGIRAYMVECPDWQEGPTAEVLRPCYSS